MPTAQAMIALYAKESVPYLKKIIISKGQLQGNFYYAGVTKGTNAGIVITLTARDPKGAKVTSQGKKLRLAIPGAKFARGIITTKGSKLQFVIHTGNATKGNMKLGFKKAFADKNVADLKSLLRRSIITVPGDDASTEEVVDSSATINEVEVSSSESADLAELLELQGDLAERNEELAESFLSVEAAQSELQEILTTIRNEINELERSNPQDKRALQAKRYELAEAIYIGTDPFPEVGERLPSEIQAVLSASMTDLNSFLSVFNAQTWNMVHANYHSAMNSVLSQIEQLRIALLNDDDEELRPIAEYGLNGITKNHRTPLEASILEVTTVKPSQRKSILRQVSSRAEEFMTHLNTSEETNAVENNPFDVEVTILSTLNPALKRLMDFAKNAEF